MGGMVAWGQWHGDTDSIASVGVGMRQLWLDNDILDETGVCEGVRVCVCVCKGLCVGGVGIFVSS